MFQEVACVKAPSVIFLSGMVLFLSFGPAGVASGAFLRPGITMRDGKSDSVFLATDPAGIIYAVWADRREGRPKIFFNQSDDGGATWLPNDLPVISGKTDAEDVNTPQVTTTGNGTVYVTWQSVKPNRERKEIWMTVSSDGGRTWPQEAIHLPDLGHAFTPQIVADAKGRVAVLWYEELRRGLAHGLFVVTSGNGGKTWGAARRLDTPEPRGLLSGQRLVMDRDGRLYVTWWETRGGKRNVVMFARSEDFGATWPEPPVRLNLGKEDCGDPALAVDERGTLYAVWDDKRNGQADIYLRTSGDHGKSWGPEVRLDGDLPGRGTSRSPQIAVGPDGEGVVAWMDYRRDAPGIYIATSRDRGTRWEPEQLVGLLPSDWNPTTVRLAANGKGDLAVVWVATPVTHAAEYRFSMRVGTDWGRAWQPPVQLSSSDPTPTGPAPQGPANPSVSSVLGALTGQAPQGPPSGSVLSSVRPWVQHPEVVIDARGTILVVWEEFRANMATLLLLAAPGNISTDLVLHRMMLTSPPQSSPASNAGKPAENSP